MSRPFAVGCEIGLRCGCITDDLIRRRRLIRYVNRIIMERYLHLIGTVCFDAEAILVGRITHKIHPRP